VESICCDDKKIYLFTDYPLQKLKFSILQFPATQRVDVLLKVCTEVAVRISAETSVILVEVSVGHSQSLFANTHAETPQFQNHFKTFSFFFIH
jgi:hypothetical protein